VKLAARGQRDMDLGPEPVIDPAARTSLQRQARAVQLQALSLALALTALLILL
jgi:hypothetical protein